MSETGAIIRSLSGRPAARNFHNFVINEIGHSIVTGLFPVGSILASDAVMMETYRVSRTVLREALKTLEAKGMLEARPKVGTRVSPTSRWNFFDAQVLAWHFDAKPDRRFHESLFDVRRALELRSVQLSSQRRTAEHVRVMKYWLHQMELAGTSVESFGLAALEVHRTIAESSGNVLLRSVTGIVELTLALALRRHEDQDYPVFSHALFNGLGELVGAIERADRQRATVSIEAVISQTEKWVIPDRPLSPGAPP